MALTKVKAGNIILTTPSSSSNDTTPATTQYVTTAINDLIDTAPSTLNTLNELAAALGDDVNFSTTVTNSIATKLPLAGGTLTGNLTLTSASKIGIGTTSPDANLHVEKLVNATWANLSEAATYAAVKIGNFRADTDSNLFIGVVSGGNTGLQGANDAGTSPYDISLNPFGGNVGIGTTVPKRPLQIGATGSFPISFNGNYPDIHMNTYYEGAWRIHTAGFGAKTTFNGATGAFGFSNVASSQSAGAAFTPLERLTILANGNVGIGNASPTTYGTSYKVLHVGDASTPGLIKLGTGALTDGPEFYSPSNNKLYINTSGSTNVLNLIGSDVGIGLIVPDGQLHVKGTTNKTLKLDPTFSSGTFTTLAFARNGTDKWRIVHPADDSYLSFYNDQASVHNLGMSAAGDIMIGGTTVRKDLSSSQGPTLSIEGAFPTLNLRDSGGTAAFYGVDGNTVYLGGHTSTAVLNTYVNGNVASELRSDRMEVCPGSNEMRIVLGSTGDPTNNTSNWIRGSGSSVMYNSASGDHKWEIGGTEKMRLYSTGEVTKPYNPAFRAYTSTEVTTNGVIGSGYWNDNQYSDGRTYDNNGDFNVSTGRFTAPKTGIYLFTVMWDSNNSKGGLHILKNGSVTLVGWEPTGISNDAWESRAYTTTAKLTANDYVQLQVVHASGSYPVHMGGAYWGHFSGVLLG